VKRSAIARVGPLAALLACSCTAAQSALSPAGVQAERISGLWWLYFTVSLAVYVLVLGAIGAGLWRRRARAQDRADEVLTPLEAEEHGRVRRVSAAVGATALTLVVLLAADFRTHRALGSLEEEGALTIRVTGHRWWWDVKYEDPDPSRMAKTANEIHVPVGRTVRLELESSDVIHSFWVPNLHGKQDLIPGHPSHTYLRADREGRFLGQCAEFCGYQHAQMRIVVVAEPEERFEAWLEAQRQPAPEPDDASRARGRQVFLGGTCVMCHSIQGTIARATLGPDLTHFASRRELAAGARPNLRGHLAGWIVDPQKIKPGASMPPNPLPPEDLRALLDYLQGLR
jgi:cytochrome c oxidase subunit II